MPSTVSLMPSPSSRAMAPPGASAFSSHSIPGWNPVQHMAGRQGQLQGHSDASADGQAQYGGARQPFPPPPLSLPQSSVGQPSPVNGSGPSSVQYSPAPSRSESSSLAASSHTHSALESAVPEGLPLVEVPIQDFSSFEDIVHNVVWTVGRAFGFQAFNLQPDTAKLRCKQYVPASMFVASDHLVNILVRNMMLR